MAWSLPRINPIGKIIGINKDRRSRDMAIQPEQFAKKFNKYKSGKNATGEKLMNIADELDDAQLATINKAYEAKREADNTLKPFGLDNYDNQDSFIYWRTKGVEQNRKLGTRKEKNPRS